jgi:hypothetical protein
MRQLPTSEVAVLDRAELTSSWPIAVRTAMVLSVVLATLGAALHEFANVNRVALVAAAALVALIVGLLLPAAAPTRR